MRVREQKDIHPKMRRQAFGIPFFEIDKTNLFATVPILINFNEVEIGAVLASLLKNKIWGEDRRSSAGSGSLTQREKEVEDLFATRHKATQRWHKYYAT